MTGTPSVSVVIPTYNRRERLPVVLEPLLADPAADEIVVVVDGSTDGSEELLLDFGRRDPRLRPVVIENRGLARARLAGAEAATGEVVIALDDDVLAAPGLVTGHARRHAGRDRLLVIGYMPVASRPRRPGEFARELYAREYERVVTSWETDPDSILRTMWAGNFSMRRADYVAMAPAVARVVTSYHEDLDFGLRCLAAGLSAEFDRSLRATHLYERGLEDFVKDARGSGTSRWIVHREHGAEVGPYTEARAWTDLPLFAQPLVRTGIRLPPMRAATRAAVGLAGRLRLFNLERRLGGLLWRMEQAHAARAFARDGAG